MSASEPRADVAIDGLVRHRTIELVSDSERVRLHYVEAGRGRLVVLLHGFPEFWYSWRHQIPALADAGYRVVAPDLRGYNLSSKPAGVNAYRGELLADDVARLVSALHDPAAPPGRRACVVGHDWGGGVAWLFAMRHPHLFDRLAILNVPHPVNFQRGLKTWRQLKKSWYMFFFQIPRLPERWIRKDDYAVVRWMLRRQTRRPDAFTPEDIERYVEAIARPGALTAALNYYRALFRVPPWSWSSRLRVIERPVLVVWGEPDAALGSELADPDRAWVPHARLARLPEASHWVQWDAPERVNELLLGFLGES